MGSCGDHRPENAQYRQPPDLQLLFEGTATLSDPFEIGETPAGRRLVVAILPGSRIEGPRMQGTFLEGSMITYLTRPDGIVQVNGRHLLGMDDGPIIYLRSRGIRRISAEAMAALSDGQLYDPTVLYGRAFGLFEAAQDGPYAWLNEGIFLGRSFRTVNDFRMSYWEIL